MRNASCVIEDRGQTLNIVRPRAPQGAGTAEANAEVEVTCSVSTCDSLTLHCLRRLSGHHRAETDRREREDPKSYGIRAPGSCPGTRLFSEDPGLLAACGECAVVGDAFMFRRLAAQRPASSKDLAGRVEAHEFGAIVLLKNSRPGAFWYANFHFGTTVHTAILANYRLDRTLPNGMLLDGPNR
jgi:hypothetical protein